MSSIIVNPTNVTIDSADLQVDDGNFLMPASSSTIGIIKFNGVPCISTYSNKSVSGYYNSFFGPNSGNTTLNTTSSYGNSAFGEQSLSSLTTGYGSTAAGTNSGASIQSGSRNCLYGFSSGSSYSSSESDNIVIGYAVSGTASESHVLRIGQSGSGNGQVNKCFIGGINGVNVGSSTVTVVAVNGDQLGSTTLTAGTGITLTPSANTITIGTSSIGSIAGSSGSITGSSVSIMGGSNLTTSCSGSTLTVNMSNVWDTTVGLSGTPVVVNSSNLLGTILSTIKVKENIHHMGESSSCIFNLRPVTFNLKADPLKTTQYGLIAEEVETVMPDLVTYDKEGNPRSVKYHDLPALLLNEIQKMKKTIDGLRSRLSRLEGKCNGNK